MRIFTRSFLARLEPDAAEAWTRRGDARAASPRLGAQRRPRHFWQERAWIAHARQTYHRYNAIPSFITRVAASGREPRPSDGTQHVSTGFAEGLPMLFPVPIQRARRTRRRPPRARHSWGETGRSGWSRRSCAGTTSGWSPSDRARRRRQDADRHPHGLLHARFRHLRRPRRCASASAGPAHDRRRARHPAGRPPGPRQPPGRLARRRLPAGAGQLRNRSCPAASALAGLLDACPNVTLLATSRVVLGIPGEHIVDIRPFSLPPGRRAGIRNGGRRLRRLPPLRRSRPGDRARLRAHRRQRPRPS